MPSFRPKDLDYAHVRLLSICQVARQIRSGIIQLDISYQLINQKSCITQLCVSFSSLSHRQSDSFSISFLPPLGLCPLANSFPPFPFLLSFSPAIQQCTLFISFLPRRIFSLLLAFSNFEQFSGGFRDIFLLALIILSAVLCFPPGTIDFHRRYIQWVRIRALLTAFE